MDEALKKLVAQGLAALKAGGEIAAGATDEIRNDARDPQLKQALEQGNDTAKQWAQRVERALDEVGGYDRAENPIVQAHYEVSKKIRGEAADERSRDLGIIANGQLALHYWIVAFGTLRTYAEAIGMDRIAQDLQASLDEAKQADERHNEIARPLLAGQGADQGFMLNA